MSQTDTERDRLIVAVKEAERCCVAAKSALDRRDEALDELIALLGWGDRLAAIRNAQQRIGELMTR